MQKSLRRLTENIQAYAHLLALSEHSAQRLQWGDVHEHLAARHPQVHEQMARAMEGFLVRPPEAVSGADVSRRLLMRSAM